MRRAMRIARKYRWINRQTHESHRDGENSFIKEAIPVFRLQIQAGPIYVCINSKPNTVLHKVELCQNPDVVESCLTRKMFMFVILTAKMNSTRGLMREGKSGFVTPAIII